ncbi:MAG: PilZ domain-containing protein [Phycisphaerales bacterium]|nr:PilZ domain-containing protein [Phycisphaerales bacterium]
MLPGTNPNNVTTEAQEIKRLLRTATHESIGDFYGGKRRHQRFRSAHAFEADVSHDNGREIVPVALQDISATGLACWSKHKLKEEAVVRVREFTSDDSGVWINARVTHCTPGIRGYLIGAAFDTPASEDVLNQLAEEEAAARAAIVEEPAPSWWQRLLQAIGVRRK